MSQLQSDTVRSIKAIWMPVKIQWLQNKTHYRKENVAIKQVFLGFVATESQVAIPVHCLAQAFSPNCYQFHF